MVNFAAPQWFALTLVLPFLVVLMIWSRQRSSQGVNAFVAPRLQSLLVNQSSASRGWVVFALQLLALFSLIVALARPQWGEREVESVTEGRNVILAIDTSRSMLTQDLQPDRLERARSMARKIEASQKIVIAEESCQPPPVGI